MSNDSGGTKISQDNLDKKNIKEEEELEDGELDSDDDDEVTTVSQPVKDSKSNQTGSRHVSNKSSTSNSSNKKTDDKKNHSYSSYSNQNIKNRKRRRRSGSEDSEGSEGKRRKSSSYNRKNNRKRTNASTDEDLDSDDEDYPKLDQKMMFSMLKQMQEFFMNNSNDKNNKQNRQEVDKFFEKIKNNKSGHKEMMKFIRKSEKMINNTSHDNSQPAAIFSSTFNNPGLFNPNNGPGSGVNMFTGLQQPQYPMPLITGAGFSSTFNSPLGPFGSSLLNPQSNTSNFQNNDLRNNQQISPQQSSLNNNIVNNKKNKKRKKINKGDDKDEFNSDETNSQIIPKQLCKYFIEGHCQKGNDCDFIHQQPYNYKREVCKFYLQDSCGKGDNCTFLHKEFPCKFYHTGQECTLGDTCKFSHDTINDELKEIFMNYLENAELNEELNQAYGLSKNVQKKPPILGDVPENVKSSFHTWVWQQEMKKLEVAYTGTKRNLFCIEDEFILKEKPDEPNDQLLSENQENSVNDFSSFNKDIDERQMSFYIDTVGNNETNDDNINDKAPKNDFFTKDNDLKQELQNESTDNDNLTTENDFKTLDEVKKQWLDDESEDEFDLDKKDENQDFNDKKKDVKNDSSLPNINITKMLDALRQTSNNTNSVNQNVATTTNQHSDFWKSILNGVNLNEKPPGPYPSTSNASSSSINNDLENRYSSKLNLQTTPQPTVSQPRDPRLLKQRTNINKNTTPSTITPVNLFTKSNFKIPSEEPFIWSNGDINFKLYVVDFEKIDYNQYKNAFDLDTKLKNDPRLQNFFSINSQNKTNNQTKLINPTGLLPPLTLSDKPKSDTNALIPPPPPPLSAFDLISSSKTQKPELSFAEQILASVHLPKKDINIPEGGLSSLADLVTEKSKKVASDTSNVSGGNSMF